MMTLDKFPIIELKGSPKEVGFQHGSILKERIHSTVKWYKNIIAREEKELFALASHFKSEISRFNPSYCEEIDAIAAGAAIDPQWIYILNARSEIMSIFSNECTTVFFKNSALLGQNWDWSQELENLGAILNIKLENKPAILMMTEPGIIGKIGFNAHGVGTCLNFLDSGEQCKGIPIHIILRAIVEEASIEDATNSIKSVLK